MARVCPACGWRWPKPTGPCPNCGSAGAPEIRLGGADGGEAAGAGAQTQRAKMPWTLKLLAIAFAIYLTFRIVQMISWLF